MGSFSFDYRFFLSLFSLSFLSLSLVSLSLVSLSLSQTPKKLLLLTSQDLVPVRLVSHIPHDPVVRRVEHVVQGHCQLSHAERRAEVPPRLGDDVDDVAAELVAELAELREGEVLEVDGVVDSVLFRGGVFC